MPYNRPRQVHSNSPTFFVYCDDNTTVKLAVLLLYLLEVIASILRT